MARATTTSTALCNGSAVICEAYSIYAMDRCTCAASVLMLAISANAVIDRAAVISRHDVVVSRANSGAINASDVLTVGNGAFAFSADASGLQTWNDTYGLYFDLNTLSDWMFHSMPFDRSTPSGAIQAYTSYNFSYYNTPIDGSGNTRSVPYITNNNASSDVTTWLHNNPHRLSLAQISLRQFDASARSTSTLDISDAVDMSQRLALFNGELSSSFSLSSSGCAASILTTVHPVVDLLSTRVNTISANGDSCAMAARLAFGYGTYAAPAAADYSNANALYHTTTVITNASAAGTIRLLRTVDSDSYEVFCRWSDTRWSLLRTGLHTFDLLPYVGIGVNSSIELSCLFAPVNLAYPIGSWMPWMQDRIAATSALVTDMNSIPLYAATSAAAAAAWNQYWNEGAFVDIASNTQDPRAFELERRVILSQYLTRANSAGVAPPQETGLLCNSWVGKHHQEMRFWHQAHWGLWNHSDLLHRSDGFYVDVLPNSTTYAAFQGYDGARWPKMIAVIANSSGIDVPWPGMDFSPFPFNGGSTDGFGNLLVLDGGSPVGPLLIWHQPHVIWLADLQRRAANATGGAAAAMEVIGFQQTLVFATARFLASYVYFNASATPASSSAATAVASANEANAASGTNAATAAVTAGVGADTASASAGSGAYWMGPPMYGGEEEGNPLEIVNPSFELIYTALVLDIANEWRQLMGMARNATWDDISSKIAALELDLASVNTTKPVYSFNYNCACAYSQVDCPSDRFNKTQCLPSQSHPLSVGMYGMVNGRHSGDKYGLDVTIMNNTVAAVVNNWIWPSGWGWDFPLVAMAMTRLNWDPSAVVDMLLLDDIKNYYFVNGHNYQRPGLAAYLPGNGGLLSEIAMMVAGAEGGFSSPMAFPSEWGVQAEGFTIQYP